MELQVRKVECGDVDAACTLYDLATLDKLTGLANREHFLTIAGRDVLLAARLGLPFATIVFGIDHLAALNDALGWASGDEALKRFAKIAASSLRGTDILSRIGGDVLAIGATGVTLDGALFVGEKIRKAVEEDSPDSALSFTASVGVAVMEPHDSSIRTMLHRAEEAMRNAKRDGGNLVQTMEAESNLRIGTLFSLSSQESLAED